jgi:hypothetical protein
LNDAIEVSVSGNFDFPLILFIVHQNNLALWYEGHGSINRSFDGYVSISDEEQAFGGPHKKVLSPFFLFVFLCPPATGEPVESILDGQQPHHYPSKSTSNYKKFLAL